MRDRASYVQATPILDKIANEHHLDRHSGYWSVSLLARLEDLGNP